MLKNVKLDNTTRFEIEEVVDNLEGFCIDLGMTDNELTEFIGAVFMQKRLRQVVIIRNSGRRQGLPDVSPHQMKELAATIRKASGFED